MTQDQEIHAAETITPSFKGFVKVHKIHKKTGKKELVLEKNNLILIQGTQVLAAALGGLANSFVNTFYIGYNNNISFTYPTIDIQYSQPFNGLSIADGFGYLREPVSFNPNFLSDAGYVNNTVIFTVMISDATAFYGNAFTTGVSQIYECALVVSNGNPTQDLVFSRVNFNQLQYDNSYNLTISWGIKFQATS